MHLTKCPMEIDNLVIKEVYELERPDKEPQTLVSLRLKLKLHLESREHVLAVYPELESAIEQLLDTAFEREDDKSVELSITPEDEAYTWQLKGDEREVTLAEARITGRPKLSLGLNCKLGLTLKTLCTLETMQQLLVLYTDGELFVTTSTTQLDLFAQESGITSATFTFNGQEPVTIYGKGGRA